MLINPYRFSSLGYWSANNSTLSQYNPYLKAAWKMETVYLGLDSIGSNNLTNPGASNSVTEGSGVNGGCGVFSNTNRAFLKNTSVSNDLKPNTSFAFSFWFKKTGNISGGYAFLMILAKANNAGLIDIVYYPGTSQWMFEIANSSEVYTDLYYTMSLTDNQWYQMTAVCSIGTNMMRLYINGVNCASTTFNGSSFFTNNYGNFCIGGYTQPEYTNFSWPGMLDEIYWWKDIPITTIAQADSFASALYNSNVGSFYGLDSYTKLLCHFDGTNNSTTILDATNRHTMTALNQYTRIVTGNKKFGNACCSFESGRIDSETSSDWNFGTGDFTIDFWVDSTYNGNGAIVSMCSSVPHFTLEIFWLSDGKINLSCGEPISDSWPLDLTTSTNIQSQGWCHVAVVRYGNVFTIYLNGVNRASTTNTMSMYWDSSTICTLGQRSRHSGSNPFYGYIDELRISKGIARWTSNFTPPNQQYYIS